LNALKDDAALYHAEHSLNAWLRNPGKPVVRGEAGLTLPGTLQEPDPDLTRDRDGVWLHNYLFAQVNPGGLTDIYWFVSEIVSNDLYPVFKRFRNFMTGIPLSNGHYIDVAATVSNPNLRVLGQKDARGTSAHLWVQNREHTWKNVVRGGDITPQSGKITISGLEPGLFLVEEWDTYGGQKIASWQTAVNAAGELTIQVDRLSTDVAYRLAASSPKVPGQLSYSKWADAMRASEGDTVAYTLSIAHQGAPITTTTWVTDTLPTQLDFVNGSLSASAGTATFQEGRVHWAGLISATPRLTVTFQMTVPSSEPMIISNVATFYNPALDATPVIRAALLLINGQQLYLPLLIKQ
jgi:uncharacterized repeat protein (TIGR01451 family)